MSTDNDAYLLLRGEATNMAPSQPVAHKSCGAAWARYCINEGVLTMTKTKFVIARTSASTGRTLYLTESRTAGISFEAPGNTATGVGVANLKTWGTEAGAHRWLKQRPTLCSAYAAAGMTVAVVPQS